RGQHRHSSRRLALGQPRARAVPPAAAHRAHRGEPRDGEDPRRLGLEDGMKAIPTLVAGYGNMGEKHARALRGMEGLWGIAEPSAERRERAREELGCRAFASVADALRARNPPACAVV